MTKRRLPAAVAALLLLIPLSGCADWLALSTGVAYDGDKYRDEFENRWGYTRLDADGQALYGALYTAVTDTFDAATTVTVEGEEPTFGVDVPLPTPVPVEDTVYLEQINTCFQFDNPQFFHISTTRYATTTRTIDGVEHYTSLSLLFTLSPEERTAAKAELESAVAVILAGKPDTDDQYLTELYLHDRLTAACTYDHEAAAGDRHGDPAARSAYGALVEGSAICGGYTQAMTLLLQRCGIPVTYVMNEDGEHVWNLVQINGQAYHLDATWNDTDDRGYHSYFNCSTEEMAVTHDMRDASHLPACDATKDNYYRRTGIYTTIRDSEVLAQQIAAALKNGDEMIEILTRPEAYEYCLLFLKNPGKVTAAVNAELTGSGRTMWEYELYSMADEHKLFLHKVK